MLGFFTILLLYSLLTFGAVLPTTYTFLYLVWVIAFTSVGLFGVFRRGSLPILLPIVLLIAGFGIYLNAIKLSVGILAGAWTWWAIRKGESNCVRWYYALVILGIGEACLGLFQFFVSPGWIFGYFNPTSVSSGTFMNRNHFAGLLEMVIPASIGLGYIAYRRFYDIARSYFFIFLGAVLGVALVLSVSRMGIFSFFATSLLLGLLVRGKYRHYGWASLVVIFIAILMITGLFWIGIGTVVDRYAELLSPDAGLSQGRPIIFANTVEMIRDYPLGVGINQYQHVFKRYQTFRNDLLFDHTHNDILETTAEWGLHFAIPFWVSIVLVWAAAIRRFYHAERPEDEGILLGSIGAIFSIVLHSFTDFNLQIPVNAMLFFGFIGTALAISSNGRDAAGSQELLKLRLKRVGIRTGTS